MIIDNNVHWLPETLFSDQALLNEVLRIPPKSAGLYAEMVPIPGTDRMQFTIEQPKGYKNLNYTELDVNAEKRIKALDIGGVDKGILRVPCLEEWASLEMCRKFNNMMYETVQKNPDRLHQMAIVPPWGDKDSLYELERCVKELGCVGVEMAAHYGNLHMDDEEFRPHLKKIAELGVPIVIHHTPLPAAYESIYDNDQMRRLLGRCFAQLTCLLRNVYNGLFAEVPNLTVIHSYLAGGFFAFNGFLGVSAIDTTEPHVDVPIEYQEGLKRSTERFTKSEVAGWFKNNIYFDMCHALPWGKEFLEFAIKAMGADHVLYGSSYPINPPWFFGGVDFMNKLDITDEERALVMGGNAQRLFKLQ